MNNKFKPEEVPDWVNWIAQDASGEWYGYRNKPVVEDYYWRTNDNSKYFIDYLSETELPDKFLYKSKPPKDFTQELYRWE